MTKPKLLKVNNEEIFPITHEEVVLDDEGRSVKDKLGDLNQLQTENKDSLVEAINELKTELNGFMADMITISNDIIDNL